MQVENLHTEFQRANRQINEKHNDDREKKIVRKPQTPNKQLK